MVGSVQGINMWIDLFRFALAGFMLFITQAAVAQSEVPRVEGSVHYSFLRLDQLGSQTGSSDDSGVGDCFTVNLKNWLGVEAGINYFPKNSAPRDRTLGLFGVFAFQARL